MKPFLYSLFQANETLGCVNEFISFEGVEVNKRPSGIKYFLEIQLQGKST